MGNSFCGGPGYWVCMLLQPMLPTHVLPQGPSGKAEAEALTNGTWDGGFDFSTCFEDAFATWAHICM
jgi:hypothetical protein